MIYLDYPDLIHVATRTLGHQPEIRDRGLLESALGRPRATVFGEDAYPDLAHKAAALVHSLVRNHALVDGNKRLALSGLIAFLGLNGRRLTWSNDEAYDAIVSIAAGEVDEVDDIAALIRAAAADW